jgi:hypothetical protein
MGADWEELLTPGATRRDIVHVKLGVCVGVLIGLLLGLSIAAFAVRGL